MAKPARLARIGADATMDQLLYLPLVREKHRCARKDHTHRLPKVYNRGKEMTAGAALTAKPCRRVLDPKVQRPKVVSRQGRSLAERDHAGNRIYDDVEQYVNRKRSTR